MFGDIESVQKDGWYNNLGGTLTNAQMQANRDVINGFEDYVAGRSSADPSHCSGPTNGLPFQYGIYSQASKWSEIFGSVSGGSYGQLPNTLIWAANWGTSDTDPNSFAGVPFFANSLYNMGNQFWGGTGHPDHDVFYEPMKLPVFGQFWGT